nr:RusA family crossover junction endodeoxyribonuclease [Coralloluteibacterium stylophorae]
MVASLDFPFEPAPASRPRVSKWGTYFSGAYKTWRETAAAHLAPGATGLEADEPLLVVHESICKRPKTTKKKWPKGDVDNHVKGPLDAITKATGWWTDDDQIVLLLTAKRFAAPGEEPHTAVSIYRCG